MTALRVALLCFCGTLFFFSSSGHAADSISPPKVRAAFLYNFALYVDWPSTSEQKEFVIAVIGDDEVGAALPEIVAGRTIRNLRVNVKTFKSADAVPDAQIVYAGQRAMKSVPTLARSLNGKHVLLVTDGARLESGAAINFVTVDRRIRFEISLMAAQRAGLPLSSRLLGAAIQVERNISEINAGSQ